MELWCVYIYKPFEAQILVALLLLININGWKKIIFDYPSYASVHFSFLKRASKDNNVVNWVFWRIDIGKITELG